MKKKTVVAADKGSLKNNSSCSFSKYFLKHLFDKHEYWNEQSEEKKIANTSTGQREQIKSLTHSTTS